MRQKVWLFLLVLLLISCFSVNAWAAEPFYNLNQIVTEGQKVENVFLYGENGLISGEVADEVVVINGNLTLTKTARVKDRVFVVGGKLTQEPGATVGKGIFHINLDNKNLNSLLLGFGAFALIELGKLALALYVFLAGLIAYFAFKARVNRAQRLLQTNMLKTGLLGFFAAIGLGLIMLALTITVWGIPVAIFLVLLVLAVIPIGLGALNLMTGELLLKSFAWGQKPFYQMLIGSLFMVALFNFPVLGILWGLLILAFSLGAFSLGVMPIKTD